MVSDIIQTPIDYLKGVGPSRAKLLRSELGVKTFQDLIYLFPRRYIDRTQFYSIGSLLQNSSEIQVIGQITGFREISQKRGKRLVATFQDSTGQIELVWFRGHKWIRENLKIRTTYVVFGKVNLFNGSYNMPHPEIELKSEFDKGLRTNIQPIYPSTEILTNRGISNKVICKLIEQIIIQIDGGFLESLSNEILNKYKLISKNDALLNLSLIHISEPTRRP